MKNTLLVLAAAAILALDAGAQTSARLKLAVDDGPAAAAELESRGFDVLHPTIEPRSLEVIVLPAERAWLRENGWEAELLSIGRPLVEIMGEPEAIPSGYSNLNGIYADMNAAAASYPSICQVVNLTQKYGTPQTWEGRDLFAVKISDNVAVDEDEPNLVVVSNHHAREIVTPVIALTAIDRLTSQYGVDPAVTAVVDDNEIWIAPTWNPDGYNYVYYTDNWWRKNRRVFSGGTGCDQNRNYDNGWHNGCSGSTTPSSSTYKGPSPNSEAETQTMIAWAQDRRFAKVLDFHSYGRETLHGYACWNHPWDSYYQTEAILLSQQGGYGSSHRYPSADGEHQQWHFGRQGSYAFLIETHNEFQPSFVSGTAEANQLQPALQWMYERPIPLTGTVTESCSGAPIDATIEITNINFPNGEVNSSGGLYGRYYVFAPNGTYTVRASATGFTPVTQQITITSSGGHVLDFVLGGGGTPTVYCTAKVNSQFCTPAITYSGAASASSPQPFDIGAMNMLNNKNGVLFYGFDSYNLPFQGGFLCVKPPVKRTPVQNSGGNPPPADCSGTYSFDFNAYIQSGADPLLVVGASVFAGYWARDPADFIGFGTSLSDAVAFTICP